MRDDVTVDLLAPDGIKPPPELGGGLKAIGIPGGSQALGRAEPVVVCDDERQFRLRRPSLMGAILEGYMEATESALLPAGEAAVAKLLAIYELQKAVYELRYELNNRPDWVHIPVAAITRLVDAELD